MSGFTIWPNWVPVLVPPDGGPNPFLPVSTGQFVVTEKTPVGVQVVRVAIFSGGCFYDLNCQPVDVLAWAEFPDAYCP